MKHEWSTHLNATASQYNCWKIKLKYKTKWSNIKVSEKRSSLILNCSLTNGPEFHNSIKCKNWSSILIANKIKVITAHVALKALRYDSCHTTDRSDDSFFSSSFVNDVRVFLVLDHNEGHKSFFATLLLQKFFRLPCRFPNFSKVWNLL